MFITYQCGKHTRLIFKKSYYGMRSLKQEVNSSESDVTRWNSVLGADMTSVRDSRESIF